MEERNTEKFKKDEFVIREYVKNNVGKGKVSKVKIEYTPIGEKIIISTHKPGQIMRIGGEKIDKRNKTLKN